jgi:hypothetical protein
VIEEQDAVRDVPPDKQSPEARAAAAAHAPAGPATAHAPTAPSSAS